jgi:hypothetical protein
MVITARQTKKKLIPYTEFTLLLHQYNKECGLNFVDKTYCLNCNSPLSTAFCGHCGQPKAQRISFSLLLKIMQRGIIEFKSPLIVTFLGLFINPGKVYREYLDGRRATYFNPIRYSFWVLTFSMFITAYLDMPIYELGMFDIEDEKYIFELLGVVKSFTLYLTFFLALVSAACLKIMFRRDKYSISELYIPCLLNISHVFLVAVVLILLGYYTTTYGEIFYAVFSLIYFVWGISHLFQQRTWWTYVKVFCSGILAYVFFAILFAFIAFVTLSVKEGFNEAHNTQTGSEQKEIIENKSAQQ